MVLPSRGNSLRRQPLCLNSRHNRERCGCRITSKSSTGVQYPRSWHPLTVSSFAVPHRRSGINSRGLSAIVHFDCKDLVILQNGHLSSTNSGSVPSSVLWRINQVPGCMVRRWPARVRLLTPSSLGTPSLQTLPSFIRVAPLWALGPMRLLLR